MDDDVFLLFHKLSAGWRCRQWGSVYGNAICDQIPPTSECPKSVAMWLNQPRKPTICQYKIFFRRTSVEKIADKTCMFEKFPLPHKIIVNNPGIGFPSFNRTGEISAFFC